MAKKPALNFGFAEIRSDTAQGTALTATDTSVLATDLLDARLEGWQSGMFVLCVEASDDVSADETYVVALTGRTDSADAYDTLATITVTRGTNGIYQTSVAEFRRRLNLSVTVGGTTPSITFGAVAIATEQRYNPDEGTAITS